ALAMSCAAADGSAAALDGQMASAAQAAIATVEAVQLPADMRIFASPCGSTPIRQLIAASPPASVTFRLHLPETFVHTRRKDSTGAFGRNNMPPRLAPMAPATSHGGPAGGPRETGLGGG